jgi:hypothetical protein
VLKLISIKKDLQSRAMLSIAVVELKRRAIPGHDEVGKLAKVMAKLEVNPKHGSRVR